MTGPRLVLPALALLALAGCSKPDNAPGPGGVSMGEARALDEAAQMLDAQTLPEEATQPQTAPAVANDPQPPEARKQ